MKNKRVSRKGIVTLIGVVFVLFLVIVFILNRQDKYDTCNEENKQIGEVQHLEEKKDKLRLSIFYPKFEDEPVLNKIVEKTYKDFANKKVDQEKKNILYMDYESKYVYKQYIVLEYMFTHVVDGEEKTSSQTITYDCKFDKVLTLNDCLRGDYEKVLKDNGAKTINKESTDIEVDKKDFYYLADNQKVKVNYEKNKQYIALLNNSIPSNAPKDVKKPNTMKIDKNKKMVAITLDDGPHTSRTEKAMKAFEKYNGRGTFFQLGSNMEKYPDIVKDVYERGHEIASHTYSHKNLARSSAQVVEEEISKTQEACFKASGYTPKLVRPPYGSKNTMVKDIMKKYNLSMILWDGDTLDWRYSKASNGPQQICDNIVRDAHADGGDGNIILIHDIHENSILGLEMALEKLDKEGYQFVTVSDLYQYKGHQEYK